MNRSRIIILIVAVLVVGAIAIGVSRSGDASLDTAASEATVEAAQTASESGKQKGLPEFAGELFGGGTLASSDIKGPAVIHIYGSWCPSCASGAPAFAQLQREQPDLNYYYVAVEDEKAATKAFAKEYGWKPAPTIDDASRDVETAFGLSGQPHTVFVNEDGAITVHQGPGSFGDLNMLAEQIA